MDINITEYILDKPAAITATMHLLDAANILIPVEPEIARSLIGVADAIMKSSRVTKKDLDDNRKIINDISNSKIPDKTETEKALDRLSNEE